MFVARLVPIALLAAAPAVAAPVTIAVNGPGGAPLAGAVVTMTVAGRAPATPRGPYQVEQRDIQFRPNILIVPVGASVLFPNRDRVRHHVYSFSKPKKFELKLYGREEARAVTFDKPGVVALGCNIHDPMKGFVFVSATPWAAQADAGGRVRWGDVPAGAATLSVWHPSIRAPGNMVSQPVSVGAGGLSTSVTVLR